MKNLFAIVIISIMSTGLYGQNNTAGKVFKETKMFNAEGKSFTLGSNKSMDIVLESFKAYNALDLEKYLSFSVNTNEQKEFQKKWFNSLTKVEEKPYLVLPLRLEGAKEDIVVVVAEENREFKNGSKEKVYVVEFNKLNQDGQLVEFTQFQAIPKDNEFGKTSGGKFIGKTPNENSGKPLVFSNRGELAIIEKMAADYNKLDANAFASAFAEKLNFSSGSGKKMVLTHKDIVSMFSPFKSVEWKLISIAPLKISDSDPASGAMVSSTEKRVYKDGKVEEVELMEMFYFDLNGKISAFDQFSKPIASKK